MKMTDNRFSAEHKLMTACCRWPPTPEAILAAAGANIDWTVFINLLHRHGVVALAGNALWKANVTIAGEHDPVFRASVRQQVRHALDMASETARLAQAFARARIACRFFKGPTLAQLAYADFGLKRSADIDVLIPPAEIQRVCDLLDTAGFVAAIARDLDPDSFARYLCLAKEVAFIDQHGTVIEIHLQISENKRMLRNIGIDTELQDIMIGSVSVPTFSDRLLYPYLCYHGAVHGWSRLKWLADLNAFLADRDVASLHESAIEQGVEGASLVALSLCQTLLGRDLVLPSKLSALRLFQRRISLAAIRHPVGGSDVTSIPMTVALRMSSATIGGNFRSAMGSFAAVWIQPNIRAKYADRSAWMFHALRLPRFVLNLLGRFSAKSVQQNSNLPKG
jgi:hypothetical protein